jgi:hypothetical protein
MLTFGDTVAMADQLSHHLSLGPVVCADGTRVMVATPSCAKVALLNSSSTLDLDDDTGAPVVRALLSPVSSLDAGDNGSYLRPGLGTNHIASVTVESLTRVGIAINSRSCHAVNNHL